MQILDQDSNIMIEGNVQSMFIRIQFLKQSKYTFALHNRDKETRRVFFAVECLFCGDDVIGPKQALKDDVKKKLNSLHNINRNLDVDQTVTKLLIGYSGATKGKLGRISSSR